MRAVLDACVLYPTILREILLDLARAGLIEPVWSPRILSEWTRAAARLGPEGERVARLEAALAAEAFPQAMARDDGARAAGIDWPDPADRHVAEAALAGGAALIVTANLRDFPPRALAPLGLEARHPDALLADLWLAAPAAVEAAVSAAHARALAAGGAMTRREMLKRLRLPRLAKRIG